MANKYCNLFDNDDGLTFIQTEGVALVENGRMEARKIGGTAAWNVCAGGTTNSMGTAQIGNVYYWKMLTTSNADSMWLLRKDNSILHNPNAVGIYNDATNRIWVWDGAQRGPGVSIAFGVSRDIKAEIVAGGIVDFYHRTADSDTEFDENSSVWTFLASSVTFNFNPLGTDQSFFHINLFTNNKNAFVDTLFHTTNGVTEPCTGIISQEDDININLGSKVHKLQNIILPPKIGGF